MQWIIADTVFEWQGGDTLLLAEALPSLRPFAGEAGSVDCVIELDVPMHDGIARGGRELYRATTPWGQAQWYKVKGGYRYAVTSSSGQTVCDLRVIPGERRAQMSACADPDLLLDLLRQACLLLASASEWVILKGAALADADGAVLFLYDALSAKLLHERIIEQPAEGERWLSTPFSILRLRDDGPTLYPSPWSDWCVEALPLPLLLRAIVRLAHSPAVPLRRYDPFTACEAILPSLPVLDFCDDTLALAVTDLLSDLSADLPTYQWGGGSDPTAGRVGINRLFGRP